jgi:ankyrin repeat domain-containing protein 50
MLPVFLVHPLTNDWKVVEPWSSVVGDPGREHVEAINANHMDMCRFNSKDDPGYQQVGTEIKIIVQKCHQKLQG